MMEPLLIDVNALPRPRTIEQAVGLAAQLAGQFSCFGAMIHECRTRWADLLKEQYGIEDGAWDVTRDLALDKLQSDIARLRGLFVALCRSRDDHSLDPKKVEVLRRDFDNIMTAAADIFKGGNNANTGTE
jgi:hypothetical protein